jgi:hypothetical protein
MAIKLRERLSEEQKLGSEVIKDGETLCPKTD